MEDRVHTMVCEALQNAQERGSVGALEDLATRLAEREDLLRAANGIVEGMEARLAALEALVREVKPAYWGEAMEAPIGWFQRRAKLLGEEA